MIFRVYGNFKMTSTRLACTLAAIFIAADATAQPVQRDRPAAHQLGSDLQGPARRGKNARMEDVAVGRHDRALRSADTHEMDLPGPGRSLPSTGIALLRDGSSICIQDGVYERRDADGAILEARVARQIDYARIKAARSSQQVGRINEGGLFLGGGHVSRLLINGRDIYIAYDDGWSEEIRADIYLLHDKLGRVVVERPVRGSDRRRLFTAAQ